MKNLLLSLFIIFFGATLIISCTKSDLNNSSALSQNLKSNGKVNPDAPYCGPGYYFDFYLGKCVPVCPSGYHNDSITGACVLNGGNHIVVITNPNNPYDFIGIQHNNGVSTIFPTIDPYSSNLDSEVLAKDISYLSSIGYNADSMENLYNQEVQNGYLPFSNLQELDSLGNTLYANGLLSFYGNSYVQQIYNYSYEYLNTDSISVSQYNSFANSLISLEGNITNDSRISSWEKEVLLSACSIGRYSGAYWGNYINNLGSISQSSINPLHLSFLKKLLHFVEEDIGGGIAAIGSGARKFWPIFFVSIGTSITSAASAG